jgi:hypothetical protein
MYVYCPFSPHSGIPIGNVIIFFYSPVMLTLFFLGIIINLLPVNLTINNFHFPSYTLPPPHILSGFNSNPTITEAQNVSAVWVQNVCKSLHMITTSCVNREINLMHGLFIYG